MLLIRTITRALMALAGAVMAIALLGPWALYFLGLHGVEGRPSPPEQIASPEAQMKKWTAARGVGPPQIPHLNPYTYIPTVNAGGPNASGVRVAWWVARDYLLEHQRYRGWWHLSGAALTIWLTRNWTPEQLLSVEKRGSTD